MREREQIQGRSVKGKGVKEAAEGDRDTETGLKGKESGGGAELKAG